VGVLAFLTGCGEEAKTKEYYDTHLAEAKAKVEECKKLEKSDEVQKRDCQNAKSALFMQNTGTNPFEKSADQKSFLLGNKKQ
jgi:hypothetical protein